MLTRPAAFAGSASSDYPLFSHRNRSKIQSDRRGSTGDILISDCDTQISILIVRRRGNLMLITPAYAAIFAFIFIALSVRTLRLRRQLRVAIGHGNEPKLERAARAHANFAEYVPISLLLIYFLEIQTGGGIWIHLFCIGLLLGRIVHAYGVSQVSEDYRYRATGMSLTLIVIMSVSIGILWGYV